VHSREFDRPIEEKGIAMSSVLIAAAAVLFLIEGLFGTSAGFFNIPSMLTLILVSFVGLYIMLMLTQISQAAR
jgi:hypothetical protein